MKIYAVGLCLVAVSPLAGQTVYFGSHLQVPTDTLLPTHAGWPLRFATDRTMLVTVILAPVAPDTPPLHLESHLVRSTATLWPLRRAGGAPLEPGIYRLLVITQDSTSGVEATRVRVLAVERIAADTQAHPAALDRAMFLPESAFVTTRRPGFLLIAGIGVAALATSWSFQDGEAFSPITIVVPGALAVGGLVGFLKGRVVSHPEPQHLAHNRQLVDDDLAARRAIAGANARALAAATWRVRVIDQP